MKSTSDGELTTGEESITDEKPVTGEASVDDEKSTTGEEPLVNAELAKSLRELWQSLDKVGVRFVVMFEPVPGLWPSRDILFEDDASNLTRIEYSSL